MRSLLAILGISALALAACGGDSAEAVSPDTEEVTEAALSDDADASASTAPIPAPEGSRAAEPMIIGSPDAPLTIVEYASVTCPACAAFHSQLLPEVKERYIDTGKVRFEFREFPTAPQNLAYAGFYLARCAATKSGPDAYYAMLDTLYARQREWAYGPTPGAVLEEIAAQAGIDRTRLEECFRREDVKEAVRANIQRGIADDDVSATPTLLVDGEVLQFERSAEGLMEAIERELAARQ